MVQCGRTVSIKKARTVGLGRRGVELQHGMPLVKYRERISAHLPKEIKITTREVPQNCTCIRPYSEIAAHLLLAFTPTTPTMAHLMNGPGILYVKACINSSPSNPLDEPTYLHWYDDDHIAEIVATSGMPNAFRYFHVSKIQGNGKPTPQCPRPYLAFYPMPDVAFTQGAEFKAIRVKSDILPGTGICYDMADNDVGYYALVGQKGNGQKGRSYEMIPFDRVADVRKGQRDILRLQKSSPRVM